MSKSSKGRAIIDNDILARYTVGELLGQGSYGTVYAAEERKTHKKVAIKIMPKEKLGAKGQVSVRNEITVMTTLQHPKILRLHQAIYSKENISLVLDHVVGGELFKHLLKLQHYSERTASAVMKNLLIGIKYMHDEGICHRDLKPDNMLLVEKPSSKEEVTEIKVADFGFACKYKGEVMKQPCGTPYYIAPEILQVGVYKTRSSYNEMVDLWSAGVIAFILLCGYPPFNGKDKSQLFASISKGVPDMSKTVWKSISAEGKEFVLKLLNTNPQMRLNAEQALKHPWIGGDESSKSDLHLTDSLDSLREFNAKEKMKGAVFGVEATLRMMYLAKCKENKLKPNSTIVEQLTAATSPVRHIDLKNNYLGPEGVTQLVSLLTAHTEVTAIDLTNSLIDDDLCGKILVALVRPTSHVTTLILNDNPITHATGRKILSLIQARKRLCRVSIEGTHISDAIKRKIKKQLDYNEELHLVDKQLHNKPQSADGAAARTRVVPSSVAPKRPNSTTTASRLPAIGNRHLSPQQQAHQQRIASYKNRNVSPAGRKK